MPAILSANSAIRAARRSRSPPGRQRAPPAGPRTASVATARLLCRTAAARPWPCSTASASARRMSSSPCRSPEVGAGRRGSRARAPARPGRARRQARAPARRPRSPPGRRRRRARIPPARRRRRRARGRAVAPRAARAPRRAPPPRRGSPSRASTDESAVSTRPAATLASSLAVEGERLLERRSCLLEAVLLLRGLRPALEQRRALGVAGGGERERLGQARLGALDVERERALAGQGQVADRASPRAPAPALRRRRRAPSSSALR